jgi:uncharacterized membrane protein (UPF0127 family)
MLVLLPAAVLTLAGCGPKSIDSLEDLGKRTITFPGGEKIRAELVTREDDLRRGLMHRDSLAEGTGMLFAYGKPGVYKYWMYNVKFPIDIIWLDENRRIVQIIHKVPPCTVAADQCPVYGGEYPSLYVIEVNAGVAGKLNLRPGMVVNF